MHRSQLGFRIADRSTRSCLVARLGSLAAILVLAFSPAQARAAVEGEPGFVFNTFAFLIWGALVMWMAAGFTMLEAGSVRTKNASAICLKNIGLYAIAGLTFYAVGFNFRLLSKIGGQGCAPVDFQVNDIKRVRKTCRI